MVQASSCRPGEPLANLAPMTLDRAPPTAWIDAGKNGAVGQWLQIPTQRMNKLRGIKLQQGTSVADIVRISRLRLACLDLQGNASEAKEMESLTIELADAPAPQRILFNRPLGACHAIRLTIQALHGSKTGHASIAEVEFLD